MTEHLSRGDHRRPDQSIRSIDTAQRWRSVSADDGLTVRVTEIQQPEVARQRQATLEQIFHPGLETSLVLDESSMPTVWVAPHRAEPLIPQSVAEVFSGSIRLCEALAALHAQGLGHGNLNPEAVADGMSGSAQLRDYSPNTAAPAVDLPALGKLLDEWLGPVDDENTGLATLSHALQTSDNAISVLTVRDQLEDLRLAWRRGVPWSGTSSAFAQADTQSSSQQPSLAPQRKLPIGTLAAIAAALALVISLLLLNRIKPADAPVPAAVQTTAEEEAPPEPAPRRPPTAEELEQLLADRKAADAMLDDVINLQLDLKERAIEQWAAVEFEGVAAVVAEGENDYRQQQFSDALQHYQQARDQLLELDQRSGQELARQLELGQQALAGWQSAAAHEAFQRALAIDETNSAAQLGQQRSATLDQVRDLLKQARAAHRDGQLYDARSLYQQIRQLDPLVDGPEQALAEIGATLADEAFRSVVSEAMAALQANRWALARAGFEEARRMRPNAQVVADGLLELDRRQRETDLQQLQQRAEAAAARQDWPAAEQAYAAMLAKDNTISTAQQGRRRAQQRATVEQQLDQFLQPPFQWLNQGGRDRVATTLATVDQLPEPGSNIATKASELRRYLSLSERPVAVRFESDRSCEVLVYRVARLGQFDVEQLELLPGNYVAVGARAGYRDVRREFSVPPGQSPEPVVLRCNEPV